MELPPAANQSRRPMSVGTLLTAWGRMLRGYSPLLSIEVTRECPLRCPGCYAYGADHLTGGVTLRELSDLRDDALVAGVLELVDRHRPLQVSLIGGEPLVRHKELSRILPELSARLVHTLVVTSAVIPIPREWNGLPGVRIAVSIDGLAPEHDKRRAPATYDRILKNIEGRVIDISWVVTNQMLGRPGYLDEYLSYWTSRPEVERIWLSLYTPQVGEVSDETLTPESRRQLVDLLPGLKRNYPSLILPDGAIQAFLDPPSDPHHCTFARVSVNYSADLRTRVNPCFFGGQPDCSQCGCAVSAGLHWLHERRIVPGLKAGFLIDATLATGRLALRPHPRRGARDRRRASAGR
jgi:MoaA/NifB/PqqE/SkfB family radical SAM enzyme